MTSSSGDVHKPVRLRLLLPNVHARDRARDDESLDLRSPFEDRVVLGGLFVLAGQRHYFQITAPRTLGQSRPGPTNRPPRPTSLVRGAPTIGDSARQPACRNTPQHLPAGPPQDRLWTVDDLSAYLGFLSVSDAPSNAPRFPRTPSTADTCAALAPK
jgi:hypothetical protein